MIRRKGSSNKASGFDGIKARAWSKIPDTMIDRVLVCFNACMREGVFPGVWKRAKLALIPKGVAQDEGLPKIRPICLLDEIGKVFEYIIAE